MITHFYTTKDFYEFMRVGHTFSDIQDWWRDHGCTSQHVERKLSPMSSVMVAGIEVSFPSRDIEMLFKLTWGGK